jgi:serine/threonine protein kinase
VTATREPPRTFDDALAAVGSSRPGFPADPARAARTYRRLARLLHPDTAPPGRADQAAAAFARLTAAWRDRDEVLTGPRYRYVLGPALATGDLAVLRTARYDHDGDRREAVLKIPRQPRDNDLMEHEADVLARLDTVAEARHRAYAPTLIESFRHRAGDGTERRVNATVPLTGFHTLAEVATAHPAGLDARDAAWMWRRLLTALGWAHRAGLVHGAVFPEHVLIHPQSHGLVLADWCYATAVGTDIPVLIPRHAAGYPPEALEHRPASPATDIHLATYCVGKLTGDRAPGPLRAFVRGCTRPSQSARPQDAWHLLAELDDLLERLYGPRAFRPFTMPAG